MDIQAYTQRARSVIQSAQTEAVTRDHQQMTPAHILHALLQEDGGLPRNLVQMSGTSAEAVDTAVTTTLRKLPKVEGGSGLSLSKAATKAFAVAEKSAKDAATLLSPWNACCSQPSRTRIKICAKVLATAKLDVARLGEAMKSVRTDGPVTSDSAEDQYDALSKICARSDPSGAGR